MALISRAQVSLFPTFVSLILVAVSLSHADVKLYPSGNNELVSSRRLVAEVPSPRGPVVENSPFVLAAERTARRDPLDGYKLYTGGWNISETHYWASVGYTAFPAFIIAFVWLGVFGVALFFLCCCYCCCARRSYSYSRTAYACSLILLILFTCVAIIGTGILYSGQGKFDRSTKKTLDYVVGQANLTVDNLKNFSSSLAAAKNIDVDHVFLPAHVQKKIDNIQKKLNTSAYRLSSRVSSNHEKIDNVLDTVQVFLVAVASVMLVLVLIGLLFSVLGLQFLVYVLVVIGWILVAGTFIFRHPHTYTALDDILPCIDTATANESMNRSREVTYQLVHIVNQAIGNISNMNFPPLLGPPLNYNQSGPLVPPLCSPYLPDMSDRICLSGEVNFDNASKVWKGYVCNIAVANGNEICTNVGRLTPALYKQFTAAVRVSLGIYEYAPFLTQLVDCSFARETFTEITTDNCPGLSRFSRWVYAGLAVISVSVMLSLIFWIVHAREGLHRKYNKQFIIQQGEQDKFR